MRISNAELLERYVALEKKLQEIEHSKSWRITRPLREIVALLKQVKRALKYVIKRVPLVVVLRRKILAVFSHAPEITVASPRPTTTITFTPSNEMTRFMQVLECEINARRHRVNP